MLLEIPNEKEGLLTTGIKDLTSGTFPKLNWNGLELLESSASLSSDDDGPDILPSRNAEKGPAFLAKTVNLRGFLRVVVALELGEEVRTNELEVRVAAIEAAAQNFSSFTTQFCAYS